MDPQINQRISLTGNPANGLTDSLTDSLTNNLTDDLTNGPIDGPPDSPIDGPIDDPMDNPIDRNSDGILQPLQPQVERNPLLDAELEQIQRRYHQPPVFDRQLRFPL